MTKMTKIESYTYISEKLPEMAEFCQHEIELIEKKNAKAKERAAEKRAAGDELTEAVLAALTSEFEPTATIAARIEGEDVTVSKVSYRLTQLVKAEKAVKEDIAVEDAESGKTRKVKGYKLA